MGVGLWFSLGLAWLATAAAPEEKSPETKAPIAVEATSKTPEVEGAVDTTPPEVRFDALKGF